MENQMIYNNVNYRVKKMNAIEALAFRSLFDFESLESTLTLYKTFLEYMEVEINGKWLPVKVKNEEVYMPNGIEDDIEGMNEILDFFGTYLKSLFQKSSKSKRSAS